MAQQNTVKCTVKCAARKALLDSDIKENILAKFREHSIMCTRIARLASLLMHIQFNKEMVDGNFGFFNIQDDYRKKNTPTEQVTKRFFYGVLVQNFDNPIHVVAHDYDNVSEVQKRISFREMVRRFEVEIPNNSYMDNTFKKLYQQFHVNFKNNITMHAETRLRRFFKRIIFIINPVPRDITSHEKKLHRKHNYDIVDVTINFLFEGNPRYNNELLDAFRQILCDAENLPNENLRGIFKPIERDWFKLLPIFFRLQRYIYDQQQQGATDIRNFVIVPQTSFQRRHIPI